MDFFHSSFTEDISLLLVEGLLVVEREACSIGSRERNVLSARFLSILRGMKGSNGHDKRSVYPSNYRAFHQ